MDPFFYTFLYSSTERALYKFWGGKAFRGFCPTFTRLYSAESNSISPKNVLGQTGGVGLEPPTFQLVDDLLCPLNFSVSVRSGSLPNILWGVQIIAAGSI